MKTILMCVVMLSILGCEPGYAPATGYSVIPPELQDCSMYIIKSSGGNQITVMRCPNSTTTTQLGDKQRTTAIVIDGVTYIKQ
jgi:hypothetical protein